MVSDRSVVSVAGSHEQSSCRTFQRVELQSTKSAQVEVTRAEVAQLGLITYPGTNASFGGREFAIRNIVDKVSSKVDRTAIFECDPCL